MNMNIDRIPVTPEEDEAFNQINAVEIAEPSDIQLMAAMAIRKMLGTGYTWCESEKDWKVIKSTRLIDNL